MRSSSGGYQLAGEHVIMLQRQLQRTLAVRNIIVYASHASLGGSMTEVMRNRAGY